jgi:hypothetical protein
MSLILLVLLGGSMFGSDTAPDWWKQLQVMIIIARVSLPYHHHYHHHHYHHCQ